MPVKAVVPEREPAMAKAAAVENMPASKAAATAMEHGAAASKPAAMKRRTTTVEAAATMEASATTMETSATSVEATTTMEAAATSVETAATMTATAVTAAADFRQPVGNIFRRRHRAWADRRKRFCALGRYGRQHQNSRGRKAQRTDNATDKAASGIWNCHHA
jgi:hypothetical protein